MLIALYDLNLKFNKRLELKYSHHKKGTIFTEEEIEAQRGEWLGQCHITSK